MDVDGRLLRYFVAVGEELHFTRAAERLYITQPALSKAIAQLERDLGIALLRRTSRDVQLTAAGHALLPAARKLLDDWQEVTTRVQHVAGVLRIGYHSRVGTNLASVVARFRAQVPSWRVELRLASWTDPTAGLLTGNNDLALLRLPIPHQERLKTVVLRVEPSLLAMPASHRLAHRRHVRLADVRDEPFVAAPSAEGFWRERWRALGVRDIPRVIGAEADNPDDWLEAVANGNGIALASSPGDGHRHPGIVYRRFLDVGPVELVVATRQRERRDVTDTFVRMCVEVFGECGKLPARPRSR